MSHEDAESEPRTVVYNGVGVPTVTPEEERDYWPEFEDGTSAALRRWVHRGDDVVVVGGGRGITTVVAARMTHFEGTLTTYEANSDLVREGGIPTSEGTSRAVSKPNPGGGPDRHSSARARRDGETSTS